MAKLPPFVPIARKAFRPLDKGGDVFWNEPRVFSRWEAWEDLIQQAARKPRRRLVERPKRPPVEVFLQPGELFGSVRFFAERWRWSKRRVEGFISQLTGELNRLCTRHVTPAGTVYALVNFELYNIGGTADVTRAGHERDTSGTRAGQNKRSNRDVDVNTSTHTVDLGFERFWKAYPKRHGSNPKRDALAAWHARIKEGVSPDDIMAGLDRYVRHLTAKHAVGTEFVMQAKRFVGPSEPFREAWDVQPAKQAVNDSRRPQSFDYSNATTKLPKGLE